MSRDHRKLRVFHDAYALALETYRQTGRFPHSEQFGLTSQMRRAAVSIASNIVEGSARTSAKDYSRFLQIAFGSGCELQFLITLSNELKLVPGEDWSATKAQCDRVVGQLHQLIDKVGRFSDAGR